mgnify:FL=1|jgi:hypothetical protein
MVCHSITRSFRQVFTNDSNDNNDGNDNTNFEKLHGEAHGSAWDAEGCIKLAQLKRDNLTRLTSELYLTESEIKICKIDIDKLSKEIEQLVSKIDTIEHEHALAHTIENTMQAISKLYISKDTKLISDLLEKSIAFMKTKHNGHDEIIGNCYKKRLERLQLEMDLKKKQVNIDALRVLVLYAEKEVADDTIGKRENSYTETVRRKQEAHHVHTAYDYEKIYNMRNNLDYIKELLENYKKIVADTLTI